MTSREDKPDPLHTAPPIDAYLVARLGELADRVEHLEGLREPLDRSNPVRRVVARLVGKRDSEADPGLPAESGAPHERPEDDD